MTGSTSALLKRVAFIVNGGEQSAMGERAKSFRQLLAPKGEIDIYFSSRFRIVSFCRFLVGLVRTRPAIVYVFDMSLAGVLAAVLYKRLFKASLIVETGDAIGELARSLDRPRWAIVLTDFLEALSVREAHRIVLRGSNHQTYLAEKFPALPLATDWVPDGVDTRQFAPSREARSSLKPEFRDGLVVGLVGSSNWNPRLGICAGWELVEMLRITQGHRIVAMLVGGGSGVATLKHRAIRYGIEERISFVGAVKHERLPEYIHMMDICISTQTNDWVGRVRTTGKLPLYMACGKFVLASNVGEAARVLPKEMLIDYEGTVDHGYPAKLAQRVLEIMRQPDILELGSLNRETALRLFDYTVLSQRLWAVLSRSARMP